MLAPTAENLPAVLLHLPEYINNEVDFGRRKKAEGSLDALLRPLLKFTAAFFCDVFGGLCQKQESTGVEGGARVAAVHGLMNVMCAQLLHTMHHLIGWEAAFDLKVGSSLIMGSQMKFLSARIEDVQTRFNGSECVGSAMMKHWVEASSCLCERVVGYVTVTDFVQSTGRMCETLWVRCNGEALVELAWFQVFDELCKTPIHRRKRKQGHVIEVEDGGLLGFAACKDLQVSLQEHVKGQVPLDIQDLWVPPKRATRDAILGMRMGLGCM